MTQVLSLKTLVVTAVAAFLLPMSGHSQSAPALPAKMHWCAVNCITLVLYHGHYVAENNPHPEQSINCGLFTVERFTRESVVMHRTDCEPPGSAVLTGKISDSGNAIVNGIITWTSHPCCGTGSRSFHAAWGSEIDSIPGGGVAPLSLDQPPTPAAALDGASVPADALVAKVNAALASAPQQAKADTVGAGQAQIENVPALIDECEEVLSRKNCATWKWNGAEYVAIWGDGTVAHMTVQQWNRGGVILQRTDYGADRSSATYKGRLLGDGSIAGEASLLANLVMAWNTMKMQSLLDRWNVRRSTAVPPGLIGRIAPTRTEGINLRGVFTFPIEQYQAQLLPSLPAAKSRAFGG